MDELSNIDGTIVSSSQHIMEEWITDRRMPPMIGIILSVYPADQPNNFTAQQTADLRGIRHECTVLASDYLGKQPDILIPHVTVPPMRHSGVDNFEEDLPRGCSKLVDGSKFNSELSKIDYAKLDGEWCMVGFVGGNFECPFIMGWWHHPSNPYDLATSASGYKGKALKQQDQASSRSRYIRRINGTYFLVNKFGSVYLDTSESNSQVSVTSGKLKRELVSKGGHIQVDIEPSAQFEINFNNKEHQNPRLGAGSTHSSPVTDVDLPHPDQPVSGSPKARETNRSYRRSTQWETLEKTSKFSVFCENTESDGAKGEALIKADDTVSIVVSKGSDKGTMINIAKGKIQVWSDDGTQVNVLNDEVQIVTKSGGVVDLKGTTLTVSGKVDVTGPISIGGVGVPTVLGPTFFAQLATWIPLLTAYFTAVDPVWTAVGALVPAALPISAAAKALAEALKPFTAQLANNVAPGPTATWLAKNTTTT